MGIRWAVTGTWAALGAALALAAATDARAQQSDWVGVDEAKARLISAAGAVDGADAIDLGLQFQLAKGWKTYWRSPGEAGMPVQLDWSESVNVANAELLWPLPTRFTSFDIDTYGYGGEVILPIRLTVAQPDRAVSARLEVFYQVCREICIPVEARLVLDLPAAGGGSTLHAAAIRHYLARVPEPDGGPFEISGAAVDGAPGTELLRFTIVSPTALGRPELLLEAPWPFGFEEPRFTFADERRRARVEVPVRARADDGSLAAHPVTVTLVDGERAGETTLILARR